MADGTTSIDLLYTSSFYASEWSSYSFEALGWLGDDPYGWSYPNTPLELAIPSPASLCTTTIDSLRASTWPRDTWDAPPELSMSSPVPNWPEYSYGWLDPRFTDAPFASESQISSDQPTANSPDILLYSDTGGSVVGYSTVNHEPTAPSYVPVVAPRQSDPLAQTSPPNPPLPTVLDMEHATPNIAHPSTGAPWDICPDLGHNIESSLIPSDRRVTSELSHGADRAPASTPINVNARYTHCIALAMARTGTDLRMPTRSPLLRLTCAMMTTSPRSLTWRFRGMKKSIHYRFHDHSLVYWNRQINVGIDGGKPTKARLAWVCANELKAFITHCEKLGRPFPYIFEDLVILGIDVVSGGSLHPSIGVLESI